MTNIFKASFYMVLLLLNISFFRVSFILGSIFLTLELLIYFRIKGNIFGVGLRSPNSNGPVSIFNKNRNSSNDLNRDYFTFRMLLDFMKIINDNDPVTTTEAASSKVMGNTGVLEINHQIANIDNIDRNNYHRSDNMGINSSDNGMGGDPNLNTRGAQLHLGVGKTSLDYNVPTSNSSLSSESINMETMSRVFGLNTPFIDDTQRKLFALFEKRPDELFLTPYKGKYNLYEYITYLYTNREYSEIYSTFLMLIRLRLLAIFKVLGINEVKNLLNKPDPSYIINVLNELGNILAEKTGLLYYSQYSLILNEIINWMQNNLYSSDNPRPNARGDFNSSDFEQGQIIISGRNIEYRNDMHEMGGDEEWPGVGDYIGSINEDYLDEGYDDDYNDNYSDLGISPEKFEVLQKYLKVLLNLYYSLRYFDPRLLEDDNAGGNNIASINNINNSKNNNKAIMRNLQFLNAENKNSDLNDYLPPSLNKIMPLIKYYNYKRRNVLAKSIMGARVNLRNNKLEMPEEIKEVLKSYVESSFEAEKRKIIHELDLTGDINKAINSVNNLKVIKKNLEDQFKLNLPHEEFNKFIINGGVKKFLRYFSILFIGVAVIIFSQIGLLQGATNIFLIEGLMFIFIASIGLYIHHNL
ncbi:MAG: hypothetical protein ACTSU2_03150 [Promethearchaeota archaeon]